MKKNTFNFSGGDKESVRRQWHERFENRVAQTKPQMEIRAVSDETTEILIYDEIGFWGITAKEFVTQLASISTPSISVRINSPGGDVFDGLAIYNSLKAHPAKITCSVEGLAASAASFIALAGDTVSMAESSMMMIHCAWGLTIGDAHDHIDQAVVLEKIDSQLAAIYAGKTGKSADECKALMDAETWMTADEAKEMGFADTVSKPGGSKGKKARVSAAAKAAVVESQAPDEDEDEDEDEDDLATKAAEAAEAERALAGEKLAHMLRRIAIAERE